MKKIILVLLLLVMPIFKIQALSNIPSAIYYINNDLYAYLNFDQNLEEYCILNNCTIYIEYQYANSEELEYKNLDLIEVKNNAMKTLILDSTSLDYSKELLLKSRYVLIDATNKIEYLDWSQEERISEITLDNLPVPIIKDLDLAKDEYYEIDNILEIEMILNNYQKYYDATLTYIVEYRINDGEWNQENLDITSLNLDDIKFEIRLKYKINDVESKWSNTLVYEQHPEVKTCLFDSDLCCKQILNVSLCIWLLMLFALIVLILIIFENIHKRKKEA